MKDTFLVDTPNFVASYFFLYFALTCPVYICESQKGLDKLVFNRHNVVAYLKGSDELTRFFKLGTKILQLDSYSIGNENIG